MSDLRDALPGAKDASIYEIAKDLYDVLDWLDKLSPGARADFWCSIREVPGAKEWWGRKTAALAKARGEVTK